MPTGLVVPKHLGMHTGQGISEVLDLPVGQHIHICGLVILPITIGLGTPTGLGIQICLSMFMYQYILIGLRVPKPSGIPTGLGIAVGLGIPVGLGMPQQCQLL